MVEASTLPVIRRITKITGNLKSDKPYEYRINASCVAFLGPNRQGKTAALDTVRLALTGAHPCGAQAKSLAQLVPEDTQLLARVELEDGAHAHFHALIDRGKLKVPERPIRSGALKAVEDSVEAEVLWERMLPLDSMRSLVKLGSTLGREAIFKRFGECATLPVPRGLLEEQRRLWDRGVAEVRRTLGPKADHAEVLSELAAWFRRHKLESARKKRTLETSVDEQQKKLTEAGAGGEALPGLRAQLERATKWEQTKFFRGRREELRAKRAVLEEQYAPCALWKSTFDARQAEREAARSELRQELGELAAEQLTLRKALEESAENLAGGRWFVKNLHRVEVDDDGHGGCLMCGQAFDPAAVLAQAEPRVAARLETHKSLLDKAAVLEESVARIAADLAAREGTWTKVDYDRARTAQAVEAELGRLDAALEENAKVLVGVPDAYEGLSVVEVRARVMLLENIERAHEQVENEAKALREYALEEQQSKTLEQAAAAALSDLLRRTSETANAAVNAYMPEGFSAALDLEDAKWTVFGRDGKAHKPKVMSGAECGALVTSLACAWTEGAPGRFLLLDDEDFAGFDPENLALLLASLKDAVECGLLTQVFLAWSRPNEIPENWGQRIMVNRAAEEDIVQLELPFDRPAAPLAPVGSAALAPEVRLPADPLTDPKAVAAERNTDLLL